MTDMNSDRTLSRSLGMIMTMLLFQDGEDVAVNVNVQDDRMALSGEELLLAASI